jgi:hypothetical protein
MKRDIDFPKVEGVHVAIVSKEEGWYVYLINKNKHTIENVLVTSRGYGIVDHERRETSVLRHALGSLVADASILIEPIDPQVFILNNEYWVSYYVGQQIFDKKFVFVQGSIGEENFTSIPELQLKGILHV